MKRSLTEIISCLDCRASDWQIEVHSENDKEIRSGILKCRGCSKTYEISGGILRIYGELPEEVSHEKEHAEEMGYVVMENNEKFAINADTLRRFRPLFLSLPKGNGTSLFRPGGSFDNQAGNAERFFKTIEMLKLTGKERILEVGASFGWASWHLSKKAGEVVALDITEYLEAADLYIEEHNDYFDRVMADMNATPFKDESFDIIFSHSVIHHCKDLSKLFSEFRRILRPGGRVVALHECAFGVFEDKSGKALQHAIEEGFNENAYTISEWKNGARKGGFAKIKLHFFSLVDDYLDRKKLRQARTTWKLKLAAWIQARPSLKRFVDQVTVLPRILIRPKAWMIIAEK